MPHGAAPCRILARGTYDAGMARRPRKARVSDVHEVARALPHVENTGRDDRPVYAVGGRSFVFFRGPRPDAFDPETGERYDDVIVFWVESEEDKLALILDESTPFFTTPHFNGHNSVLLRGSRIGGLSFDELREVVQDAWLARAGKRARAAWLAEHPPAS